MIKNRLIKGSTLVNGLDISELGMFMVRNGGDDLLLFPDRKEPKTNNWYEHDGLDVDLSEVHFSDRSLTIQFYIYSDNARDYEFNLGEFYKLISKEYITLYNREFNRSFKLRYISCSEYIHTGGLHKDDDKGGQLKIQFSMDDPLQIFRDSSNLIPRKLGSLLSAEIACVVTDSELFIDMGDTISTDNHITNVSLNGTDLGQYGIIVNESYSSMLKLSAVKQPLTRSFDNYSGLLAFPSQKPKLEAKELVMRCIMRADNRVDFYHNYEALFNNLTKPEALQIDSYLGRMDCYYNRMTDFRKLELFAQGVTVQFTLHLTQIDPGFTYYTLGSQKEIAIQTDTKEYILI